MGFCLEHTGGNPRCSLALWGRFCSAAVLTKLTVGVESTKLNCSPTGQRVERPRLRQRIVSKRVTVGEPVLFWGWATLYFVYVLRNSNGRLYIGFTTDLERRVQQHQQGEGGWTRGRGPWELVHFETFDDRVEAMRRERNLKRGKLNQGLRKKFSSTVERVLPQKD